MTSRWLQLLVLAPAACVDTSVNPSGLTDVSGTAVLASVFSSES